MAYDDLLKSVEETAKEKERELLAKAGHDRREILEGAKKQAETIRRSSIEDAERIARGEKNKILYQENTALRAGIIRARDAICSTAFIDAQQRLAGMREDSRYPGIFRELAAEAVAAVGTDPLHIHIDPRDEQLCREIMAGLGISGEIFTDLNTAGGLVLRTADESVTIENTFESRLERARDTLRLDICTILFGG